MRSNAALFFLFAFQLFLGNFAIAQTPARPLAKDIEIQKLFIEANKEKVLGNIEDAEYIFNEVVKKDKGNAAAYYELARLHITAKNLDKAGKSIKSAIAIEPENIWYNTLLADLHIERGEYKEAAEVFAHLSNIAPEEIGFKYELATLYARMGKADQAIKVYNEIEDGMGINAETTTQKHALYLGLNKPAKAAQELEKLIAAFPTETNFLLMLAEHYEKTGTPEKAKPVYEKIISINPQDPVANLALAEDYHANGQDAKYLNALQGIFSNPSVDIDLKIQEIIPYIGLVAEKNDPSLATEATKLTQLLCDTHPEEAKAFAIHGDMLNHADRPEEALAQYKKSAALNSSIFSVWEQMLFIESGFGKTDDLLKTSEEAIELFPNQPIAFFFNGVALSQKQKHDEAIDALQQALMMAGRNEQMKEQIYVQLGGSYYYTGNYKKSDEYFDKALSINETDALALNNYSFYLAERGANLDKAEKMSAKANELAPDTPSFLDTYGWILYKQKKYKEAKEFIAKALKIGGENSPEILENFGDVLFKLNEVDEAVKYWQKASEKGGNSDKLSKKIENRKIF